MFEPEKEIEAVNKRVDRLTEYTSYNCDLQIKMFNKLEEVVLRQEELSEAITVLYNSLQEQMRHAFTLSEKMNSLRFKGYKKEKARWLQREMDNLKSQVEYLKDKVFEKKNRNGKGTLLDTTVNIPE